MVEEYDLFGNIIDDSSGKKPEAKGTSPSPKGLSGRKSEPWTRDRFIVLKNNLTVEELSGICAEFNGRRVCGKKAELIYELLEILSFNDSQTDFDAWFQKQPEYLQKLLKLTSFHDYIPALLVEQICNVNLINEFSEYYRRDFRMNPDLKLAMFEQCAGVFIGLKPGLRKLFAHWIPQPAELPIRSTGTQEPDSAWSNVDALPESIPLMLNALQQYLDDYRNTGELARLCRKGLKKADIKAIRAACGQNVFPQGQKIGVDPIDLWLRFLSFFHWTKEPWSGSIQDYIQQLVKNFFDEQEPQIYNTMLPYCHSGMFEYEALFPHMSRIPGRNPEPREFWFLPHSRRCFQTLLHTIAKTGQWYEIEELLISLEMQDADLSAFPPDVLSCYRYKADAIVMFDFRLALTSYHEYVYPEQAFKRFLVGSPLLKAYCYLMASLGILEMTERDPKLLVERGDKLKPVSPYESLDSIRITAFGRWCLGLEQEKPALPQVEFEALADRELLLVTFKGKSLERRLYLEDIGEKLGEDRYRISAGSFIQTCTSEGDIIEKINRFHELIDENPAPHWKDLFDSLQKRARVFSTHSECSLFSLSGDSELRRLVSSDMKIAALVVRAEADRIVVKNQDLKKFFKHIREAGYLPPEA